MAIREPTIRAGETRRFVDDVMGGGIVGVGVFFAIKIGGGKGNGLFLYNP